MPLSEQNFRILFEQAPLGIVLADLELRLVSVNPTICSMLRYAAEDLIGHSVAEITYPPDVEPLRELLERMVRGDFTSHRVEKHCVRKDQVLVPTAVTVSLLRDAAGAPLYFAGMVEDLTEQRKTFDRLRFIENATQDGIWDVDLATGKYEWSDHLYESIGYKPGEIDATAETADRLIHPEDIDRVREAVNRHLRGETLSYEAEFRIRHKKGHYLWVLSRGKALLDKSGKPVRLIGAHADITRQKAAEVALREAQAQAEQASRAKDDFLAVLSHELRTPLTPVLTSAQMMEEDATLSAENRQLATMIRRNVELEARLIDDLLDLTRIARDKLALNIGTVDVHQAIDQALRICAPDIGDKDLRIVTDLAAQPHVMRGDAARLQQVFWNLLKNAVKFSFRHGLIEVQTRNGDDGRVEVIVKDHGIGIDGGTLPRIFNAFEQGGRDVTRQFGGLGLGLAIAKVLVELHDGTIQASSAGLGKGAMFTVSLPALREELADRSDRDGITSSHPHFRVSILLVEDHDDTRKVMVRYLETIGCAVVPAASVARAIEIAETEKLDLVISDIGLPDGSGTDLMRHLADRYGLKGVALSGYGMQEDIRRSEEAGFFAHLTKPIDLRRLDETIRSLVSPRAP
ncbi:MAG: PAS domain S-box protein [Phycisphaerae bacterium]